MGKAKQQVISRFFAAKPKEPPPSESDSQHPPPPSSSSQPKISATVSFSPSKRLLSSQLPSPSPKLPRLSHHTHNPSPSLHQKFLHKLLEPSQPLPENPQSSLPKKHTPLELQVLELKTQYPDVLLMVEVGYRYRFFGEDADVAARVLGIYAHVDHNFMTASVPTFRLNFHVRRLVSAGYKVGVVKQTETAAIKSHGSNRIGPFSRGLSALYTKATLEAAEDVGGEEEDEGFGAESKYLACIVEKTNSDSRAEGHVRIGIVAVEISTGDVVHGEFNDNFSRSGLEAMVLSLTPAELLLGEPLSKETEKFLLAYAGPASNVRVERTARDSFNDGGALAEALSLYEKMREGDLTDQNMKVEDLRGTSSAIQGIMSMPDLAVQALVLTIRHLKQFGFERIMCLGASFRAFSTNVEMALSANAIQQLEVLRNYTDGSERGSLVQSMNHTLTVFGSRLLRHWVAHPLCDGSMISSRLDAVAEMAECMGSYKASLPVGSIDGEARVQHPEFTLLLSSVLTTLGRSPDIQRGITRIFHGTATASEFIAVIQAIVYAGKQLQHLNVEEDNENMQATTVRSVLLRKLIMTASSPFVIGSGAKLLSSLNKEAADQGDLSNLFIISDGQFTEVATSLRAVQLAKEKLHSLIGLYRKQLKMSTLDFLSVSGTTHLIELPLEAKVPLNWVKVNSTKKTIRYHPPEVLTALDQLSLANEELLVACRAAWASFLKGFGNSYAEFQAAVGALAALDCLHSLAILARNRNYVRPIFVDDDEPVQIQIQSGRHPVLETLLHDSFVPNDTNLHANKEYCQIVTGPNMGGKSCYIRQVALIAIMAQVGSFVPASSAKLHVLDGIYTRIGASDSIQQGRSTFLEELSEASHILHNCTARSLVIIDELGRGTSTHDGVAIAYATLHHLLDKKKCMALFVTHYPKIADLKTEFPGSVEAYHVSYLTSNSDHENITYLYKLVPGVSERSFGLNVAQLAQLPASCISRANTLSAWLESVVSQRQKSRLGKEHWLGAESIRQEQGSDKVMSEPPVCFYKEGFKEFSDDFSEFLWNLRSALQGNDVQRLFHFLKHATSAAKELISRETAVSESRSMHTYQ